MNKVRDLIGGQYGIVQLVSVYWNQWAVTITKLAQKFQQMIHNKFNII